MRSCRLFFQCGDLVGGATESEAPTETTDRVCSCDGEFYFTGTICAALSVCDATTQFQSAAPTQSTDRQCTAIRTCSADSHLVELEPPTATTDRTCQCDGDWYKGPTDSACRAVTTCSGDRVQTADGAPTPTTDRQCDCNYAAFYCLGGTCSGASPTGTCTALTSW